MKVVKEIKTAAVSRRTKNVRLTAVAAAIVGVTGLMQGQADAAATDLVISQLYGGGALTSATYNHDYVELFNNGTSSVNLSGLSLQYISATSTSTFSSLTLLSGTIAPGAYFLVQENGSTTPGVNLPTPDQSSSVINMSTSGGKIALVNGTTGVSSTSSTGSGIIDFVGWGTANTFETTVASAMGSNTNALIRKTTATGYQDTNVNSADFLTGAATPHNSASTFTPSLSANFVVSVSTNSSNDNLLVGAPISDFAGIATVTNNGTAAGSYTATSTGVTALTLTGDTSDPSVAINASTQVNYVPTTVPNTFGTFAAQVTITPGTGSPVTANFSYFVGNAQANNSNNTATFGAFTYIANIVDSGSYANLSSRVTSTSGSGGGGSVGGTGSGITGSTATILFGTNTTGSTVQIGEDWRTRTTTELTQLVSDVLKLTSTTSATPVNPGTYVLQINYIPGSSTPSLSELVGGVWGNAVLNNASGTPVSEGDTAWNSGFNVLGEYGFDSANNVAWAVVDHPGTFAVATATAVPEPASLGLLAIGGLGLLARRRREIA